MRDPAVFLDRPDLGYMELWATGRPPWLAMPVIIISRLRPKLDLPPLIWKEAGKRFSRKRSGGNVIC